MRTDGATQVWRATLDENGDLSVDDMVLGTYDELKELGAIDQIGPSGEVMVGAFSVSLGDQWPDGRIPYSFDTSSGYTSAERATIINAMNVWHATSGIEFRIRTTESDWVEIRDDGTKCSSEVGRTGGKQYLNIDKDSNCMGVQNLVHEMGHTIGLKHEHQRPDRDDYLVVNDSCAVSGASGNFDKLSDSSWEASGPYDYDSVMSYASYTFTDSVSVSAAPDSVADAGTTLDFIVNSAFAPGLGYQTILNQPNSNTAVDILHVPSGVTADMRAGGMAGSFVVQPPGETDWIISIPQAVIGSDTDPSNYLVVYSGKDRTCPTIRRKDRTTADPDLTWNPRRIGRPTAIDTSAMYWLYADQVGGQVGQRDGGERLGTDIVIGDFDGDGRADLATTAPGDLDSGVTGAVAVFRGGYTDDASGDSRMLRWKLLNIPNATTLATGDFNDDGIDDLAVGNPDTPNGGWVRVLLGDDLSDPVTGGVPTDAIHPALETSWLLSPFDEAGTGSNAIALPSDYLAATGRPWDAPDARFGGALAVGDINGDGIDDLIVGAPGAETLGAPGVPSRLAGTMDPADHLKSGVVVTFLGSNSGGTPLLAGSVFAPDELATPGSHQGAEFGATLAIDDFNGDGCDDLAVGAPGDPRIDLRGGALELFGDHDSPFEQAGRVFVFSNASHLSNACSTALTLRDTVDTNEVDGLFGSALASPGSNALVVGAPGMPDVGPTAQLVPGVGVVLAYTNTETATISFGPPSYSIAQSTSSIPGECAEAGDEFGASLAVIPGTNTVFVGAPGEDSGCSSVPRTVAGSGRVFEFSGTSFAAEHAPSAHASGTSGIRFGESISFDDNGSSTDANATLLFASAPDGPLGATTNHGYVVARQPGSAGGLAFYLSQDVP